MATHKVVLKPSVEKDLRPLPKSTVARIMKRIGALEVMTRFQSSQSSWLGQSGYTGYASGIIGLSTELTKQPDRWSFITFDIVERSTVEFEESGERVQFETRLLGLARHWSGPPAKWLASCCEDEFSALGEKLGYLIFKG